MQLFLIEASTLLDRCCPHGNMTLKGNRNGSKGCAHLKHVIIDNNVLVLQLMYISLCSPSSLNKKNP